MKNKLSNSNGESITQNFTGKTQKSLVRPFINIQDFERVQGKTIYHNHSLEAFQQKRKTNQYQPKRRNFITQFPKNSVFKTHIFYTWNQQKDMFFLTKNKSAQRKILHSNKAKLSLKTRGRDLYLKAQTSRKRDEISSESFKNPERKNTSREYKDYITPLLHRYQTENLDSGLKINMSLDQNLIIQLRSDLFKNTATNKPLSLKQQRMKRRSLINKNKQRFSIKTLEDQKLKPSCTYIKQKEIQLLGTPKKMSEHSVQRFYRNRFAVGLIILHNTAKRDQK